MTVWTYEDTPAPVGLPINMNGSDLAYELGLYDGATHGTQYPDEPDHGVLFETPETAKRWLEAVVAVLTPYIESEDREPRIPDPTGWDIWVEPKEEEDEDR
jgi:hypothetical protein